MNRWEVDELHHIVLSLLLLLALPYYYMEDMPRVAEAIGRVGSSWKEVWSVRLQYKVLEENGLDKFIIVGVGYGSC